MNFTTESQKIEYLRYKNKAALLLKEYDKKNISLGPDSVPFIYRKPYLYFKSLIDSIVLPGFNVLDVCCGDGKFSFMARAKSINLFVSDIVEDNVKLAVKNGNSLKISSTGITADAMRIPLPDASIDVITCAGSLSYVEIDPFLIEIERILKVNGRFLCIDSFNHNIIYRVNRFFHFIMGNRSWLVNSRIPNDKTLKKITENFQMITIRYFGIISFLVKPLSIIIGEKRASKIIDFFDSEYPFFQRYAFKIVFECSKQNYKSS